MKTLTDLQHKKLLEMAHKEKQEAEVRLALSWESVMKKDPEGAEEHFNEFTKTYIRATEWVELAQELKTKSDEKERNDKTN